MIKVIKPGLQTTVQDQGRIGLYEIGMPPSGAMDKFSYTVGNLLVGNQRNAAALEITYLGPVLQFGRKLRISITGGNIPPKINGQPAAMWKRSKCRKEIRCRLTLYSREREHTSPWKAALTSPVVMNSRSTYTLIGIGGFQGRALAEGDELAVGDMHEKRS